MTKLTESAVYSPAIFRLETNTPVAGGPVILDSNDDPVQGHANAQAQLLANRTKYLKEITDSLGTASTRDVLGTVSQSGGVPTGAIIERGSNANGDYVRWADGTQICTKLVYTGPNTIAAGSIWRSNPVTGGDWSAAFTTTPNVGMSGTDYRGGGWPAMDIFPTPFNAGDYSTRSVDSGGASGVINLTAVGRWF